MKLGKGKNNSGEINESAIGAQNEAPIETPVSRPVKPTRPNQMVRPNGGGAAPARQKLISSENTTNILVLRRQNPSDKDAVVEDTGFNENEPDENLDFGIDDINGSVVDDEEATLIEQSEQARIDKKEKKAKNQKKMKYIPFIAGGVLVLLIGLTVAKRSIPTDVMEITTIDASQYKGASSRPEPEKKENTEPIKRNYTTDLEVVKGKLLKLGQFAEVKNSVSIQETRDSDMVHFEAPSYFGITNIYRDEADISKLIKDFEKKNKKEVDLSNIPDDIELLIVEAKMEYPKEYPTNLNDGKVTSLKDAKFNIVGTYVDEETGTSYDDKIVIGETTYSIIKPIALYKLPDHTTTNQGVTYLWLVELPKEAEVDSYKFAFECGDTSIEYERPLEVDDAEETDESSEESSN